MDFSRPIVTGKTIPGKTTAFLKASRGMTLGRSEVLTLVISIPCMTGIMFTSAPLGKRRSVFISFFIFVYCGPPEANHLSSANYIFLRTSDKDAGAIANPLMDRDTNQTSANLSDCLATYSRGIYCQSPCQRHLGGKNVFMILIIKKISLFLHSLSSKEDNIDANRQQLFLIEYD